MKNQSASSPEPTAAPGVFGDTIAVNRTLPVVEPSSIVGPPVGYKATDAKVRQRALRKVNADHVAEGKEALGELAALGSQLATGKRAKCPARARRSNLWWRE